MRLQAAKTDATDARAAVIAASSPMAARVLGQTVPLRVGWDDQKRTVMARLLRAKFSDARLAAALLATGTGQLVEVNTWGDRYWGVCAGRGENHLGRLRWPSAPSCSPSSARASMASAWRSSAAPPATSPPHTAVLARQRISLAIWRLRPQVVIFGGCPKGGVNIWARDIAGVHGYTITRGDFVEHLPAQERWAPDGYQARNA